MKRLSLDLALPGLLLLLIVACLASPLALTTPPPVGGSIVDANQPAFTHGHLLGTDMDGNDVWSRLLQGGRTSLTIALTVNILGILIGGALGATSAYLGGFVESLLTRTADALIAFPALILVLAIAQTLGPGELNTIWALAFFSMPIFARIARAATLQMRGEPFVIAATLCGASTWRILIRHVAPNILPQLAAFALLSMGTVINIEGAVSFLGLGVPLPQPSWGNMIYQGQLTLSATPLLVLLPSVFLFLTALAFNMLGEALRTRWVTT